MRLNIYAEELTTETEVVTKTVKDDEFGERTFYGIRFFLKSPPELHHTEEDDDRSAITLWCRWTRKDQNDFTTLDELLRSLHERVEEAEARTALSVEAQV